MSNDWRRSLRRERTRLIARIAEIDTLLAQPRVYRKRTLSDRILATAHGMTSNETAAICGTTRKYVDRILRAAGWKLLSNGVSSGQGKAIERFWQRPS